MTGIPSTIFGSVHHADFGREREREKAEGRGWSLLNPGNQILQASVSSFCPKDLKGSLFLNILGLKPACAQIHMLCFEL